MQKMRRIPAIMGRKKTTARSQGTIERKKRKVLYMIDSKIKGIIDNSVSSLVEEMQQGKSERLTKYLEFCSNFYRYSYTNTMLIFAQMPSASRVAGYKTWNNMGYQVKKGEKAIKVLAPTYYKYIVVGGQVISYKEMTEAQKKDKSQHKTQTYFVPVNVFDISQCVNQKGEEVPRFFTSLGDTHKEQYEGLKAVIINKGINVNETADTNGAEGVSYGGKIDISVSADYNNKLLTLIHEFAHEILDHGANSDREKADRTIRELRAEAVSYIVGRYMGLDNPFSSDYIQCYGNTAKDVETHLEAIVKASNEIIKAIEEYKGIECEEPAGVEEVA